MGEKYLLLVRHASRDQQWHQSESEHSMQGWAEPRIADFAKPGYPKTAAMTALLANVLLEEAADSYIDGICHSPHLVAAQTAEVMMMVLNQYQLLTGSNEEKAVLAPGELQSEPVSNLGEMWVHGDSNGNRDSYTILIGHQPDLTDLAVKLLGSALPTKSLPLGGSEIACIRLGAEPRLVWLLTAKGEKLLEELKDKIKSKVEIAKFFLGAFVVNTAILLTTELWQTSLLPLQITAAVALVCTLLSLLLTASTLFAYDELMTPVSLWGGSKGLAQGSPNGANNDWPRWNVRRSPSQAHMVIYYEMIHIWNVFFLPAMATAFIALVAAVVVLVFGDAGGGAAGWPATALNLLIFGLLVVVTCLLVYFYWRWNRPVLGVDD